MRLWSPAPLFNKSNYQQLSSNDQIDIPDKTDGKPRILSRVCIVMVFLVTRLYRWVHVHVNASQMADIHVNVAGWGTIACLTSAHACIMNFDSHHLGGQFKGRKIGLS